MTDAVPLLAIRKERKDIKATDDVPEVIQHQIGFGQFPNLALLESSDRVFRPAEIGASPGFDLDKDEGVPVIGNDIDFTPVEAEPAADNPILFFFR